MKLLSVNPSTSNVISEVDISTEIEIKDAVVRAQKAKQDWKEAGVDKRAEYLSKVDEVFTKHKEDIAQLASQEMGMPINDARFDSDDGLRYFKWYLDNASSILTPEVAFEDETTKNTVYYEPFGVAAVIVPWNFPFSNFIWQVIPNLIAGNVVVFKASEEVPLFGKYLESLIKETDLPAGVFQEVYGDGKVGDYLVRQDIDLISFTGSSRTGAYLYQLAAEKMIKAVLELGGSAPGIVLKDADVDGIIDTIVANRFMYCGQVCDGLKRLIVHESKYDEVLAKLVAAVEVKKLGMASEETTMIGPLVAKRQLELLEGQVQDAVDQGAKIVAGGQRPEGMEGCFYLPTILTNISKGMRVWREEVFGPVLPIATFDKDDQAIELANDTQYGLGGYIFSENTTRAELLAKRLDTGMVAINNASYLQPSSPFGGCKRSGLGREHGKYGLHELTQVKVIAKSK